MDKKACSPLSQSPMQVRRTSSQYHQHCVPDGSMRGSPLNDITPISARSNSPRDDSLTPNSSGRKKSAEQAKMTSTPIIPSSKVKQSVFSVKKSNFLYELSMLFDEVPINEELEEVKEDADDDSLSLSSKFSPPSSSPALSSSPMAVPDENSALKNVIGETWKSINIFKEPKKPIGTRIVLLCDTIHGLLNQLDSKQTKLEYNFELLMTLSSLRELLACWLTTLPLSSSSSFEEAVSKLISSCYSATNLSTAELNPENIQSTQKLALNCLGKLIFFVGKRLLEINASLEEDVWSVLNEFVMDNLAKGSSTQFSVALHSLIDQVSSSQMHISSLAYQSFASKKSESIRSLLEVSIELLDEMRQVMRKFKTWHEYHNGENTLSKCYEIQFLWHSEYFQYLSNLHSLTMDFTQNISKVVKESSSVPELPLLEKILENIKTNLHGIQKSLPFSSEPESESDSISESLSLLNDLESVIRNSIAIIGKQLNLINTSFICCKGILKKTASYSSCIELSTLSFETDSEEINVNINRRVHFSDSVNGSVEKGH